MRLCFLTGEYPPMQGGVADHTRHLAQHLAASDVQVAVLTSAKATPTDMSAQVAVEAVITGWGPGCWRQIDRFLAAYAPDVLHIQYQAAAYDLTGWINWLPWRLQRRRIRPRVVVTLHDLRVPYLFPKAGRLREWTVLALARFADAVITTNVEDEQALRRHAWAAHVQHIPLGNNIEVQPPAGYDRQAWRHRLGVSNAQILLGYFGFLNQSKGGEELVETLSRLVQLGRDAHLLMIGGQMGDVDPTNRAYLEQVRALIRTLGLDDRVHWTGHTAPTEVSGNLLALNAVVMPYRDGASFRRTTFIAALRHGCAVVTTQPAVTLPDLRHAENVLLTPVGDTASMADAVIQLTQDAALAARVQTGARALGSTFDWPAIARRTRAVYSQTGY
jgi:glycosyltransferase involved in cell wall biosynthesis